LRYCLSHFLRVLVVLLLLVFCSYTVCIITKNFHSPLRLRFFANLLSLSFPTSIIRPCYYRYVAHILSVSIPNSTNSPPLLPVLSISISIIFICPFYYWNVVQELSLSFPNSSSRSCNNRKFVHILCLIHKQLQSPILLPLCRSDTVSIISNHCKSPLLIPIYCLGSVFHITLQFLSPTLLPICFSYTAI